MATHSSPTVSDRQPESSRLLGPEHERALQAAAEDRERARGALLATLFTLPGKAWSAIRDHARAGRRRAKPAVDAR